jgi:hypothetical protein
MLTALKSKAPEIGDLFVIPLHHIPFVLLLLIHYEVESIVQMVKRVVFLSARRFSE